MPGRNHPGQGGGIISPLYPWRYDDAVTQLALWGQKYYPGLLDEIQQNSAIDPEYMQSGLVYLDIEDEIEQAKQWQQKNNYSFINVPAKQIDEIEPGLNYLSHTAEKQAWFSPGIGQLRNPRLVKALRLDLVKLGVEIKQQTQALSFIINNNQLKGIITDKGSYYADQVVIAGGAWSSKLLEKWFKTPKIAPVKGQMIVFKAKPGVVSRIVLSQGRYVIPRKDGRVVVGSTLEHTQFDKSIDDDVLEQLKQQAYRIIPALKDYPVEKQWAGLRPGSIDGIPYIGEHPELKNLYINAGHFRNGVVIGLGSCQLLVDQLLNQNSWTDPAPYALTAKRLVNNTDEIDLSNAI